MQLVEHEVGKFPKNTVDKNNKNVFAHLTGRHAMFS